MSATAALVMMYDGILASIHAARDISDEALTALLHLFGDTLVQALYLVDRRAVQLLVNDQHSRTLLPAIVHSRHPEPARSVLLSPPGASTAATSVMHDWCECAEYALVAGGVRGAGAAGSSGGGQAGTGLPFPICVHLLAGQLALRTNRVAYDSRSGAEEEEGPGAALFARQNVFEQLLLPLS
ncbi:hypothetical protein OC842_002295 [Tilletia horrida]|uniref:Uncharacterized protein n=1 Tax=Tilletia horrida TaxID=155126 RepID=A0AAN6JMH9_9BASI|nr:hypothetical protein OC842_002295 [Tilletia horrida]